MVGACDESPPQDLRPGLLETAALEMDSEEKSGAVAARVSDEVQPVESVADTEVNGHHNRSASMSASFLAAPGYSPSFASLGNTGALVSHHAHRFSDTFEGFEGFEPPRLSQEVQDTPKVTRPEGLSFTTPIASMKIPEEAEVTAPEFTTPVTAGGGIQSEGAEDTTSPIANLVESNPAAAAPPAAPTPASAELTPTFGNVNSFSFGAVPQTPDMFTGANPTPSPSTPTELVPALGNAASFSFGDPTPDESSPSTPTELIPALGNENSFPLVWPPTSTEPHVISMKVPGHELLESFTTTNYAAVEAAPEAPAPVSSDVKSNQVGEPEPIVAVDPKSEAVVQPKTLEAAPLPQETSPLPHETSSLPEEPVVAATPPSESHQAPEPPIVLAADPPAAAMTVNNAAEVEVVQKPVEHETDIVTESKDLPQPSQITTPPETFAFRNVETEKEVPAPAQATPTPKPGVPFLGTLKAMSTKKYRGPSDVEVRSMVVIPDYLSRNMANAVTTEGVAAPEGPRDGEATVAPTSPILVFINSRSGGRLGPELMSHFEDLISSNQVYDLSEHSPSAVLRYGIGCLDRMASDGDECARQTRENLRILVAGGDGTVGWCLSSLGALREFSPNTSVPPLGIIPLGTGNDLSRSFGWGGEFTSTDKSALKKCLVKALNSSATPLDTWKAVVLPAKSVAAEDIQFPHSMHPQHHVPLPSSVAGEKHEKDETAPAFEGLFFNYFSVGMDAQVAYGFHHLRDEKPWLARSRKANEMIYSTFGCTQGWFCTPCATAPRTSAVSNILQLFVKRRGNASNDWEEIHIPSNIRALVICNLKSYAGGHNPWGKPASSTRKKEGLEEQRPDDGLLEVMGLRDGWHSAFVLLEVATAIRLCQAEAVKMEFNCNVRKEAYLQMDGEPWMQPLGMPRSEPTVVVIDKLPEPAMVLKR